MRKICFFGQEKNQIKSNQGLPRQLGKELLICAWRFRKQRGGFGVQSGAGPEGGETCSGALGGSLELQPVTWVGQGGETAVKKGPVGGSALQRGLHCATRLGLPAIKGTRPAFSASVWASRARLRPFLLLSIPPLSPGLHSILSGLGYSGCCARWQLPGRRRTALRKRWRPRWPPCPT